MACCATAGVTVGGWGFGGADRADMIYVPDVHVYLHAPSNAPLSPSSFHVHHTLHTYHTQASPPAAASPSGASASSLGRPTIAMEGGSSSCSSTTTMGAAASAAASAAGSGASTCGRRRGEGWAAGGKRGGTWRGGVGR